MKKKKTTLQNKKSKALNRLRSLRENAERVQREIELITEQLELLNQEIEEGETSSNDSSTNEAIVIGDRVEYNKKAGKRLRKGGAHNPRGTVIRVTDHYIYIHHTPN